MSELISNGDPAVVQVVSAAKDLHVIAVGNQSLCQVINLFRFL